MPGHARMASRMPSRYASRFHGETGSCTWVQAARARAACTHSLRRHSSMRAGVGTGLDVTKETNMCNAINDAMRVAMETDDKVCVFGEDVGFGGVSDPPRACRAACGAGGRLTCRGMIIKRPLELVQIVQQIVC